MRQKTVKNHYELLGVSPSASEAEIEDAYKKAKETYTGSVALYSLYSEEEKAEKIKEIERAYETLCDPGKRDAYNAKNNITAARIKRPKTEKAEERPESAPRIPIGGTRDAFEEYRDTEAFRDKLTLKKQLIVMDSNGQQAAENYRILYMKMQEAWTKRSDRVFAVTSAVSGEGKTVTALNLAYIIATEFRKKTLLMECDLRNPSISTKFLDMGRLAGLVDVLKGDTDLKSAINRLEDTDLYFLPARSGVRNSSVLLDSPRMKSVLNSIKSEFDYIIVDSPPALPLADINIISKSIDSFLLVVRAGKTSRKLVSKALEMLPLGHVMGIVLNGTTDTGFGKYYY